MIGLEDRQSIARDIGLGQKDGAGLYKACEVTDLDDRVDADVRSSTLDGLSLNAPLPQVQLHPDRPVSSGDQPGIVGLPILNPVLALGFLSLLFVLAHRFRPKARILASSSKVDNPVAPTVCA